MPRMVARLIPVIAIGSLVYLMYLLVRVALQSRAVTKRDRTKMVFVAIMAFAATVILFTMTATSG